MLKTIHLFDFDKTIISQDSIFLLWRWAARSHPSILSKFPYHMLKGSINYRVSGDFTYMKNSMLRVLKYLNDRELEIFVKEFLYPNYFYREVFEVFESFSYDSVKILVSASAINYLKYVADILPFDHVIGTKVDGNFRILGENNKFKAKVTAIKKLLKEEDLEIDLRTSTAYSDSYKHDRPMLEMVDKRYLINSKLKIEGYENLRWHLLR